MTRNPLLLPLSHFVFSLDQGLLSHDYALTSWSPTPGHKPASRRYRLSQTITLWHQARIPPVPLTGTPAGPGREQGLGPVWGICMGTLGTGREELEQNGVAIHICSYVCIQHPKGEKYRNSQIAGLLLRPRQELQQARNKVNWAFFQAFCLLAGRAGVEEAWGQA